MREQNNQNYFNKIAGNYSMFLSDILVESSRQALSLQLSDGSFPPGFNGPYHDPETPVRNTAHWLITMLKAFKISRDNRFKDSALKAVKYLLSSDVRPMRATFYCRKNPEKDFCNGLIGQAWAIEALGNAGIIFEDTRIIEVAKSVFKLHPFDSKKFLWRKVNVDGSFGSFDLTFNHQLWFAASASTIDINSDMSILRLIEFFLEGIMHSHLNTDSAGRITHTIQLNSEKKYKSVNFSILRRLRKFFIQKDPKMIYKENGYHAFNLYAFSILKKYMPNHILWKSGIFNKILNYSDSEVFIQGLENNIFGYPYNPAGFEVALAIQEFSNLKSFSKTAKWWIDQQITHYYDKQKKMMCRSAEDSETLSARIYEATRLMDIEVKVI